MRDFGLLAVCAGSWGSCRSPFRQFRRAVLCGAAAGQGRARGHCRLVPESTAVNKLFDAALLQCPTVSYRILQPIYSASDPILKAVLESSGGKLRSGCGERSMGAASKGLPAPVLR